MKGATNIKQFRPTSVSNVILRIVTKVFAQRLAPVAHSVIHPYQSRFYQRKVYFGRHSGDP